MLSKKYSLYYFKADDFLETYMKAVHRREILSAKRTQNWMRNRSG